MKRSDAQKIGARVKVSTPTEFGYRVDYGRVAEYDSEGMSDNPFRVTFDDGVEEWYSSDDFNDSVRIIKGV